MKPRTAEELAMQAALDEAAYVDYHCKRGTGTWRDWEYRTGPEQFSLGASRGRATDTGPIFSKRKEEK